MIDTVAGGVDEQIVDDLPVELPTLNEDCLGAENRYQYAVCFPDEQGFGGYGIATYDRTAGARRIHQAARMPGEAGFVPAAGATREDDGYHRRLRPPAGPSCWPWTPAAWTGSPPSTCPTGSPPTDPVRDPAPWWGRESIRTVRALCWARDSAPRASPQPTTNMRSEYDMTTDRAVLAGGCFWGMEELIRRLPGVQSTRVGYTGGSTPNATYRHHPGHAEALEIVYDPEQISYRTLLEYFFQIHDPSTVDRQGNDIGSSYRSAIFYTDQEQRATALDTIADVDASGLWPGKVVTEVVPLGDFWEAEPEHQDYLQRYPDGYTCHYPRPGWKLPVRDSA